MRTVGPPAPEVSVVVREDEMLDALDPATSDLPLHHLRDVAAETVAVGATSMEVRAFVLILPPLALVQEASGRRADGTEAQLGARGDESLVRFRQHSPLLKEWTGFIPMV